MKPRPGLASHFSRLFPFDAAAIRVVGSAVAPQFVARDVCSAVGVASPAAVLATLASDERGVALADSFAGPQEMITVTESGLYALIFRSDRPECRRFREWITGPVLAELRKASGYTFPTPQGADTHLRPPALPPVPVDEVSFARVIDFAIGCYRNTACLIPKLIAEAAPRQGLFSDILTDANDPVQVARFMRRMARYQRRWLCIDIDGGRWVWVSPVRQGRALHYHVARSIRKEGGLSS